MKKRILCFLLALSVLIGITQVSTSIAEASLSSIEYTEEQFITLQNDSIGIEVLNLQLRLIQLGYYEDEANGIYDKNTENAVIAFQFQNGLVIDGIATSEVQVKLFNAGAISAFGLPFEAYEPEQELTARSSGSSESGQCYIGNKNTKKFHYPGCDSVDQMKPSNKVMLSSRDEAIQKGYVPCKNCNP